MNSLFLRMFLWFCAAMITVASAVVVGYEITNPQQLAFDWPVLGRGAIVSAGRVAVAAYEQAGRPGAAAYLKSLARDSGLRAELFDSSQQTLGERRWPAEFLDDLASQPDDQLVLQVRGHLAGVKLRGKNGRLYAFVAVVPRRNARGVWYRMFIAAMVLTGALLCYLLAGHITSPIVHLRTLTARFSGGDLSARITLPEVLERKDEIGGLARDFNSMASRMETLMKSQRRLIADVSHELRSPITRLSLALGLLRRHKEPDSPASLSRIEREVERLNALIAQLLTLSRLEGLGEPPPMEVLNLTALVKEISVDAEFEAASMNRSVQLGECAPCSMSGAPDLIRSAVENVVRNAIKYTSPNTEVSIRLVGTNDGSTATISVADQGPGVPPEALEHIFEPFYRVDESRERQSGGAGLGLAITQQIVKLHGGSVCAMNREAGGLELRIMLPVVNATNGQ